MEHISRKDVESILDSVNKNIPQKSKTIFKEFKADYASQYGGWMIYYYDGSARARCPFSQFRISHAEAYRFFQGILFSIKSL